MVRIGQKLVHVVFERPLRSEADIMCTVHFTLTTGTKSLLSYNIYILWLQDLCIKGSVSLKDEGAF